VSRKTHVLGISAFYHDSSAALVRDGVIIAAVQEERFSRKKNDAGFPREAVAYCLREAGITLPEVAYVVFYEKPLAKFERLIETYVSFAPRGFRSFLASIPAWAKEKLFLKELLRRELAGAGECGRRDIPPLLFSGHHQAHAASAFYPSPFDRAAVLCLDGVGEWSTTTAWLGDGAALTPLWEIDFPHSLGLLYSAFTYYIGFKVNSGEYKVMGLAPYGEPRYADRILSYLIDLKDDGTFRLDMRYFNYATGLTMTSESFHDLFGGPPRKPEDPLTQRDMDLARSVQDVTEEIVLRLARAVRRETGEESLCLAGGVALNCVANGRIVREGIFRDLWVQPAAGDAGGALGAALAAWHTHLGSPRTAIPGDAMSGAYLGPSPTDKEIRRDLDRAGARYCRFDDHDLLPMVADLLAEGRVVGWVQGRMEFGPRALGGRSILADPRNPRMQSILNLKVKFRESFRPLAPSVLDECAGEYFDLDRESPYMLLVAPVREGLLLPTNNEQSPLSGIERLNVPRSTIPAVTHVDCSARIQTVHAATNPRYYELIRCFREKTRVGVLVNTSFNVRGEPIVCTAADAYSCFMRTEMDELVIGNFLLSKGEQSEEPVEESPPGKGTPWKTELSRMEIPVPDRKGLRRFAFLLAGIFALFFGLLLPVLRGVSYPRWPFAAGFLLFAWGAFAPGTLSPFYRGWMTVGTAIGWINMRVLLGIVFFLFVTPVALFFRAIGRDPMTRHRDPDATTYRVPGRPLRKGHMEVPF
jgi:carbamoyltransferase